MVKAWETQEELGSHTCGKGGKGGRGRKRGEGGRGEKGGREEGGEGREGEQQGLRREWMFLLYLRTTTV